MAEVERLASFVLQFGPIGLLGLLIYLIIWQPEKVEVWRANTLLLFSWAGTHWRRHQVTADLQGNISQFSRDMDSLSPGIMPYNMKLSFVDDIDCAELLRDGNTVLVRIRDRTRDDKNLVHAMLAFCPVGLLPGVRSYLDVPTSRAIDFTVTRKLLNRARRASASNYFYNEVVAPETASNTELNEMCLVLDRLDEHGLLERVALRELEEFSAKVESRHPQESHRAETRNLIRYLDEVASRAPGEDLDRIGTLGQYIRIGCVFVGRSDVIADRGIDPYINHLNRLRISGLERAYLMATGLRVTVAEKVKIEAVRRGIASITRTRKYKMNNQDGLSLQHVIIEIQLAPYTSVEGPDTSQTTPTR